jgi:hypothetical protein
MSSGKWQSTPAKPFTHASGASVIECAAAFSPNMIDRAQSTEPYAEKWKRIEHGFSIFDRSFICESAHRKMFLARFCPESKYVRRRDQLKCPGAP